MALYIMRRYMRQVFGLEMVRIEELPSLLMYTGHIYQFFQLNQEPIVRLHIEDLMMKG